MTNAGLVLDDRTTVAHSAYDEYGTREYYYLETRYGISTREIFVVLWANGEWTGDIIEFGEWRNLDEDEIQQCKEFLKERGYL